MRWLTIIFRSFAILTMGYIGLHIILINVAPFGEKITYGKYTLPQFTPENRVEIANGVVKQIDDLTYFNSGMPYNFEKANVSVSFKNSNAGQELYLGYRDQVKWHYKTLLLDSPIINSITWPKIGNEPYLYQKQIVYKDIQDFLNNPPKDKTIGTYDYDSAALTELDPLIPDYKPAVADSIISTPLRGKTTMYVYVNGEPFDMTFTKRDLNWYADPDVTKIQVFRQKDVVYEATIDDDSNDTDDHKVGQNQKVEIKNPGPGLPEPGVYKIIIDQSGDSVITGITTNLHKIVFEGPLLPIYNKTTYAGLIKQTIPTILTTNSTSLSLQIYHKDAFQTVTVENQNVILDKVDNEYTIKPKTPQGTITLPLSDIVVNGTGYFAFSPDQFFTPSLYNLLPIKSAEDLDNVDFVLTNYQGAPKREGDWLVAEREFDLHDAIIKKGQLNWMLQAPDLKDNNYTIDIKSIEMTLTKKGWWEK